MDGRDDIIAPGILFPKTEASYVYCACAGSLTLLAVRRERRGEEQRGREAVLAKVGRWDRGLRREGI